MDDMNKTTLTFGNDGMVLSFIRKTVQSIANSKYMGFFSDEDLEDCTMDVCVKLYSNKDKYDSGKGTLESWIWKIASNTLVTKYKAESIRRNRYRRADFDCEPEYVDAASDMDSLCGSSADSGMLTAEFNTGFSRIVDSLSESDRELLAKVADEKSSSDIAMEMDLHPSVVYVRKNRLLSKIRKPVERLANEYDMSVSQPKYVSLENACYCETA